MRQTSQKYYFLCFVNKSFVLKRVCQTFPRKAQHKSLADLRMLQSGKMLDQLNVLRQISDVKSTSTSSCDNKIFIPHFDVVYYLELN